MRSRHTSLAFSLTVLALLLVCALPCQAKPEESACIALGALAWNDWTHPDAGGSGLPAGETVGDYVRCVSCHGWDRLGENGGFVRRTRTADRPNAGRGDIDRSTRDIAPGMGDYYHVTADDILHAGRGRAFADGSGSWVDMERPHNALNAAAHSAGYTLGNQHPDFSVDGANAGDLVLTQDQLDCLVDFINFGDSDPRFYFFGIDTEANPVEYGINRGASATAGETFYQSVCLDCHGDPASDYQGANDGQPVGGILYFLTQDGAWSEFVHKARWGIPGTVMTRTRLGEPDSQDMIDVMLYLKQQLDPGFWITRGIAGSWYDPDRDGEGFQIDVAFGGTFVATFYTYDTAGNQMWLIGSGTIGGDSITVPVYVTDGGAWGDAFDKLAVNRHLFGDATFTFESCAAGRVDIVPNDDYSGQFEPLSVTIERLTIPVSCED
jgi:cytochrome c2